MAVVRPDRLRDTQPPEAHYWNETIQHVNFWFDAVGMQRDRMHRRLEVNELSSHRLADALFLLVAVYRLRRAALMARRVFEDVPARKADVEAAIDDFDLATPHLDRLRHGTEHFDEWLYGEGRRQPSWEGAYPFRTKASHVQGRGPRAVTYLFELDGTEVDLTATAEAATELGARVNEAFNRDADDLPMRVIERKRQDQSSLDDGSCSSSPTPRRT